MFPWKTDLDLHLISAHALYKSLKIFCQPNYKSAKQRIMIWESWEGAKLPSDDPHVDLISYLTETPWHIAVIHSLSCFPVSDQCLIPHLMLPVHETDFFKTHAYQHSNEMRAWDWGKLRALSKRQQVLQLWINSFSITKSVRFGWFFFSFCLGAQARVPWAFTGCFYSSFSSNHK